MCRGRVGGAERTHGVRDPKQQGGNGSPPKPSQAFLADDRLESVHHPLVLASRRGLKLHLRTCEWRGEARDGRHVHV